MTKDTVNRTTALGVATFPRIKVADTKFNEHGSYQADIRLPVKAAKPDIEAINAAWQAATGKPHPKMPDKSNQKAKYYFDTDDDGEIIKSHVILRLRARNVMTKRGDIWDRRPKVFDAQGQRIIDIPNISGGTEWRVSYQIAPYDNTFGKGISLVPLAVQIVKLVEYDNDDDKGADDYGFGEEEGFTAPKQVLSQVDGEVEEDDDDMF